MWDWNILDWMLERDDIAREEKIDAVEPSSRSSFSCRTPTGQGHRIWRQALALRDATEERVVINKILLPSGQAEWVTLTDLENIFEEPSDRVGLLETIYMLTGLRIHSIRSFA